MPDAGTDRQTLTRPQGRPAWRLGLQGGRERPLVHPLVMGILNATPDSFSDGGSLDDARQRDDRIGAMLAAGADILDVGGESTRPGHEPVPPEEEIHRVVPVIEAVRRIDAGVPISIDTQKASVARAALRVGADFVNDVSGLGDPDMAGVVQEAGCSIVLMRREPLQGDPVEACRVRLEALTERAKAAGIGADRIILDPGLGFGDPPGPDPAANLALVDRIADYAMGHPVLVGASRKRFVGAIAYEVEPARRVADSVAVAKRAVQAGAAIVRVHDVPETVAALRPPATG